MAKVYRAAALALMVSVPAAAQTSKPCVTQAEANALFSFALPELLDTAAKQCTASLPADAFLRARAPAMVQRYRAEAAPSWPSAKTAFFKSMGEKDEKVVKMFDALPDETIRTLMGAGMAAVVGDDIKGENCESIDQIASSLAPLTLSQLSTLFTSIVIMADKKKSNSLKICPAR